MTDILDQIFPYKENIEVKLIGTDLLRDIGIEVYDNESKINKKIVLIDGLWNLMLGSRRGSSI